MTRDKRLFNIWRPARSSADCQAGHGLWVLGTPDSGCEGTPGRLACLDVELRQRAIRKPSQTRCAGNRRRSPMLRTMLLALSLIGAPASAEDRGLIGHWKLRGD